jgi:hypothetical protein
VWRSFGVHVKVRGKGLTEHAELTMPIDHSGIRRIDYYSGSWTEKEVLKDIAVLGEERQNVALMIIIFWPRL